jgi:aminocarboxymuconate-semialdehyde decarboxylase
MRIDMHAHCWPETYLDLLAAAGSTRTADARVMRAGDGPDDVARRLTELDAAGIDRQVMSVLSQAPYFPDPGMSIGAARLGNDLLASLAQRHPDRLDAFAVTPLPHVDAAVSEAYRALDELGMAGIAVTGTVLGRSLADPAFAPFFAALDDRAAVLFIHPAGTGCGEHIDAHGLTWVVGAPFEDTFTALHLIQAGIVERYPRIRLLLCHLGGTLPFLAQRVDNQLRLGDGIRASDLLRRMWFDTVDHAHVPALRCAVETFGAERLVLGTDYPFFTGERLRGGIEHVHRAGLTPEDAEAITDRNASRLLGTPVAGERRS